MMLSIGRSFTLSLSPRLALPVARGKVHAASIAMRRQLAADEADVRAD